MIATIIAAPIVTHLNDMAFILKASKQQTFGNDPIAPLKLFAGQIAEPSVFVKRCGARIAVPWKNFFDCDK
jgi:hypothetical protein